MAMRFLALLAFATMAGCAAPKPQAIEFLTRKGCVQTKIMEVRTEAAIKALALTNPYTVVDIDTLPPDDVRKGYPNARG